MLLLWSGAVICVQYKQSQEDKQSQVDKQSKVDEQKQGRSIEPQAFSIPVRVPEDRAMDQELGVAYIRNAKGYT